MYSSYPFSLEMPESNTIAGSLVYDLSIFKFCFGKQYSVFGSADFVNMASSRKMILYPSFLAFSSCLSSFYFSLLYSYSVLLLAFFFHVIVLFLTPCILYTLLSRVQPILLPGNCYLKCWALSLRDIPVYLFKVSALTIHFISWAFKNFIPNRCLPLKI